MYKRQGELKLDLHAPNGTIIGSWDTYELPIRGIVEYDGHVLFAAEDGIHRYNETSNQWAAKWTAGNGLPTNAGTIFYELWTDGSDLVVGGARFQGWGGFAEGIISHRDGTGSWSSYPADSYTNIPNGYPISMEMCGGALNIAMYNTNGGIARLDLQNHGFSRYVEKCAKSTGFHSFLVSKNAGKNSVFLKRQKSRFPNSLKNQRFFITLKNGCFSTFDRAMKDCVNKNIFGLLFNTHS